MRRVHRHVALRLYGLDLVLGLLFLVPLLPPIGSPHPPIIRSIQVVLGLLGAVPLFVGSQRPVAVAQVRVALLHAVLDTLEGELRGRTLVFHLLVR